VAQQVAAGAAAEMALAPFWDPQQVAVQVAELLGQPVPSIAAAIFITPNASRATRNADKLTRHYTPDTVLYSALNMPGLPEASCWSSMDGTIVLLISVDAQVQRCR